MIGKKVKKWARRTMERNSMIGAKIHEILTCIKVVKSYNTEAFENRRYAETNRYLLKSTMRALRIGLMVGPTVETVGIILICFFLVWCFATDVKISDVVPMLAPLLIIYKPVKQLSKLQVQVETSMAALSRIYSVLDLHMELPERKDAVRRDSFTDGIVFDGVSFRYDTADSDAVKNATFTLPCGKMVAVVGGTGSGKSTMAGLLARFFDPRKGRITIDGTDVRDVNVSDLRMLVGAVTQVTARRDFHVDQAARHRGHVRDGGGDVRVGQVLKHALADDEVVLLTVAPARDVPVLEAVLLAHRRAHLRAGVGDALVVLLYPILPKPDARADVEHALHLELVVLSEREDELREVVMLLRRHDAGLGRLVKAVVIRFIEAPKPIHDLLV
jgi:subfamily B ATP-binding cassette protein MsbA